MSIIKILFCVVIILLCSVLSVRAEAITITSPTFGTAWAVGTSQPITWTTEGTIPIVNIEYSKDNFVSDINPITAYGNTNSYLWTIPDDITQDFSVKVRVSSSANPTIYGDSEGFKIRADIQVLSPKGGERWITNKTETITWAITGTVPSVAIYYSTDNFVSENISVITTPNTGSYNWQIPDRNGLKNSKVRICDSRDLTASGQSPNVFMIDYYNITFDVRDRVTNLHITAMTYMDPTRGLTIYPFSSPKSIPYPYGTHYLSVLCKATYVEVSVEDWAADSDKTFYLKMDSEVVHQWGIPVDFRYEVATNKLVATAWFTMDGLIMSDPLPESIRIDLYDESGNLVKVLESSTPNPETGIFTMIWNNTTLIPNETYLAKTEVIYNDTPFRSALTFKEEPQSGSSAPTRTYYSSRKCGYLGIEPFLIIILLIFLRRAKRL